MDDATFRVIRGQAQRLDGFAERLDRTEDLLGRALRRIADLEAVVRDGVPHSETIAERRALFELELGGAIAMAATAQAVTRG